MARAVARAGRTRVIFAQDGILRQRAVLLTFGYLYGWFYILHLIFCGFAVFNFSLF